MRLFAWPNRGNAERLGGREMSENLAERVIRPSYKQIVGSIRHSGVQEILRREQEVEVEITEQRSIGVTAHVQSGVS